jgi:ABC-type transport system substrate-binding protein
MNKRLIMLLIAVLATLFVFVACGGGNDDEEENGNGNGQEITGGDNNQQPGDQTGNEGGNGLTRQQILDRVAAFPAPTGYIVTRATVNPDANIWLSSWSNPSSNAEMRFALSGLSPMARNSANESFPDPMVMVGGAWPVITDNPDGTRTYTYTIYTDNQFSDGVYIDASHYVASILFFSHPYFGALVPSISPTPYVQGREEYIAGENHIMTGVRLYSENSFSFTIEARGLPNVWEAFAYMDNVVGPPLPKHHLGVEAHDNGNGAFLTGPGGSALSAENIATAVNGGTQVQLTDDDGVPQYHANGFPLLVGGDGFRFNPHVNSGPWVFESVDVGAGTLTIRANPYFPGTWDGYVPRFERVIWRYVPLDLVIDALGQGELHLMPGVTVGALIEDAFRLLINIPNPQHSYNEFPGLSIHLIQFHVDHGPTQFRAVRAAISHMINRTEFVEEVGLGFGSVAHAMYAGAWWWTHEAIARGLHHDLILYDLNMEEAIRLLEEDGWVLNAAGEPFVGPGSAGNYRHKLVDGELMELHINWKTAAVARPSRDAIERQLVDRMLYAGMRLTQDRSGNWPAYLSGNDQIYHMFDPITGMPVLWMPWFLNDFASGPSTNWANMDWPETLRLSHALRDGEVITEQGRYNFVTAFMNLMVNLNYYLDRIPLMAMQNYDFIPNWLGNWEGTGFWNVGMAITRAYDTRN